MPFAAPVIRFVTGGIFHFSYPDIIYHLETYDVTTCRAGIPMYLLSKYISDMGVKVVLSGEGADEVGIR